MQKALGRDIHKMHAFVRFRKAGENPERFIAWYRPDHHILEHVAPWFARRFGAMHWAILTPDRRAWWDTCSLKFGPGVPQSEAPPDDALEDLWRGYYASIFNPARVDVAAMKKELPVRHWATLPEADLIPGLLKNAAAREEKMLDSKPSAEPFLPELRTLPSLARAIHQCHGCALYQHATQPVFGEGPEHARVMFVGEQPGDVEDLHGRPFIGPAGQLWDRALLEAGVDRSEVYVTNAVKHFKFEERGKRRIHQKPNGSEIAACRPWLTAEIEHVKPKMIVALGATAALSVGGREFAIQKERGNLMPLSGGRQFLITVHPSFLLRVPDEIREAEYRRFVDDLRLVA
jgi:DNA polymerase